MRYITIVRIFWKIVFVFFIGFAFFANTLHESYPDEFDNILGGWYITQGKIPYLDFFTHHGPVPYFIAAFITFFGGQSFVFFRILYALFLLLAIFGIYLFLKNRLGKETVSFFPFFIVFLGIEGTYYWVQMILADNIAAFSFLPVYALLLLKVFYKKRTTLVDVGSVAIFSSVGLYSSLTYAYIFLITNGAILYLYYRNNFVRKHLFSSRNLYPLLIVLIPHFLFFIYLIVTRSLADYLYQNFVFNAKYYIYNYPRTPGSSFINPFRYAVLIAHWFFVNFYTLIMGVKTFDFAFPINMTMAVGDLSLIIFLLFKKQYKLALFVLLILIFTNVRSNPLNSKETDYQAGVYNMLSFFNISFLLPALYNSINGKLELAKKIIFSLLLVVVGLYSFFAFLHLLFKFNEKTISKYMGTMALVYDRPKLAPVVNTVVDRNEYMWIGPFEFEELLYANGKLPSKYHILIAGIGYSDRLRVEMLSDFNKNKPKVIFFDKNFNYLGRDVNDYGKFFVDFLDRNYTTLLSYKKKDFVYRSVSPIHVNEKLDLESKMYIRKDKVDEVINKLLEKNYIKKIQEK